MEFLKGVGTVIGGVFLTWELESESSWWQAPSPRSATCSCAML